MTNWKTFKITGRFFRYDDSDCIFYLDNYIGFHRGNYDRIHCSYISPFEDWETGDYIEIDLDKMKYKGHGEKISDVSVVRKVTSSIIATRGSSSNIVISPNVVNDIGSSQGTELARYMSRMVDETDKEFELKIEDNSDKRFTYSLICRKQK